MNVTPMQGCLYQPVPEYEDHLFAELQKPQDGLFPIGNILFHDPDDADASVFWYRNRWLKPFRLEFTAINEAADVLRGIQRNWASLPYTQFRRAALIEAKLPPISVKLRPFPWLLGESPVGLNLTHRITAATPDKPIEC